MKFDVILNHNSTRKFDKILFNGKIVSWALKGGWRLTSIYQS